MRSTFKILFYLNTSRRKKSGECTVMGRITIDGNIAQFSLKEDLHPDCWDAKKGRAKGKTREQIDLNKKIAKTETSIKEIYEQTVETCGYVTAEQVKNELTGVTGKADSLLKFLHEYSAEYEKRVGIDRTSDSCYRYKNTYVHLSNFIRSKYDLDDYPLKQLNMAFINDWELYLRINPKLKTNSIRNHIVTLKTLIKRAINQGIIIRDPFSDYVKPPKESNYRHISKEELERMIFTELLASKKGLIFVRDIFIFSCFTGLAYADICQLSEKHLRKTSDGKVWIDIFRQKTGMESNIRLLDLPLSIIEKYRSVRKSDKLFNMPSACAIAYHLHKMEKLYGIKYLHFHMARHTFATQVCLTNGVPMETVSKMMGHGSMRSTQIYAEITSQKVGADMKKLAGRIKVNNPLE